MSEIIRLDFNLQGEYNLSVKYKPLWSQCVLYLEVYCMHNVGYIFIITFMYQFCNHIHSMYQE